MAATARIVVQVTPEQKRNIAKLAKAAGLSVSELMRRAAEGFRHVPEDGELEALLARTEDVARESIALIDETLAFVAASNERIAAIEAGKQR